MKALAHAVLSLVAGCALLGGTEANASPYVVTVQEVGADVIATGSGQFDLTGLTKSGSTATLTAGSIQPNPAGLTLSTGNADIWNTFSGPTSLGPGPGFGITNNTSGPPVGLDASVFDLFVPTGYTSDSTLATSTDIFSGKTIADLGLTPGTYVWTWGTGEDQRFTLDIVAPTTTPLPAALPLFATGLGALGLLGWRRKRKALAVA